jgi:Icc-related predicted phosphoesterase
VTRIRPRLHIFGHTHGANGIFTTDDTMFLNAALFGAHRDLDAKPIVLQIARK